VADSISFSHIINPFPAREGSEHSIASAITFASLRRAVAEAAAAGVDVEVRAVVLPGDEEAAEEPSTLSPRLTRTVKDLYTLEPSRPLPLIADILEKGAEGAQGAYLIFTNMDISVQPNFYVRLRELALERFSAGAPFIVYRRNIDASYHDPAQLSEMCAASGEIAYGQDCFVFPRAYVEGLDLGDCCIGTAHFDDLLFMNLDAVSGFRAGRVADVPLTFHIGNEIGWARHMDHIEHNLAQSLAAIGRLRARYEIPAESAFSNIERRHFIPNARFDSVLLRKLKRFPLMQQAVHKAKKWLGRSY
jgi:hypothetical protein